MPDLASEVDQPRHAVAVRVSTGIIQAQARAPSTTEHTILDVKAPSPSPAVRARKQQLPETLGHDADADRLPTINRDRDQAVMLNHDSEDKVAELPARAGPGQK